MEFHSEHSQRKVANLSFWQDRSTRTHDDGSEPVTVVSANRPRRRAPQYPDINATITHIPLHLFL